MGADDECLSQDRVDTVLFRSPDKPISESCQYRFGDVDYAQPELIGAAHSPFRNSQIAHAEPCFDSLTYVKAKRTLLPILCLDTFAANAATAANVGRSIR